MNEYKIVEKENRLAVHSCGYYGDTGKNKAQAIIDSGYCIRHWMNKDAEFIVIETIKER